MADDEPYFEISLIEIGPGPDSSSSQYVVHARLECGADRVSSSDLRGYAARLVSMDLTPFEAISPIDPAYAAGLARLVFAEAPGIERLYRDRVLRYLERRPIAVRIYVQGDGSPLHGLSWEVLTDVDGISLTSNEHISFARFLPRIETRHAFGDDEPPPRPDHWRSLVAVADPDPPTGIRRTWARIDVEAALKQARTALGAVADDDRRLIVELHRGGTRATLANIARAFCAHRCAVLYLVCHGQVHGGVPYLYLEDDDGILHRVRSQDLLQRLVAVAHLPRLAILISCGSADHHISLGPQLARWGVPAVVAMRGDVEMALVERFIPELFKRLEHDGRIDRALASARLAILGHQDHWRPVLFLSTKDGRVWSDDGRVERLLRPELQPAGGGGVRPGRAEQYQLLADWVTRELLAPSVLERIRATMREPHPISLEAITGLIPHLPDELPDAARLCSDLLPRGADYAALLVDGSSGPVPLRFIPALLAMVGPDAVSRFLGRVRARMEPGPRRDGLDGWLRETFGAVPETDEPPAATSAWLTVKVEPDAFEPERRFYCSAWVAAQDEAARLVFRDRTDPRRRDELPAALREALGRGMQDLRCGRDARLTVEVYLPLVLLLEEIDRWPDGDDRPLGARHTLHLRPFERHYGAQADRLRGPWRQLWDRCPLYDQALTQDLVRPLDLPDQAGAGGDIGRPVVLASCLPDRLRRREGAGELQRRLVGLVRAGVPVALIRRDSATLPEAEAQLVRLLFGGPFAQLPERLRAERAQPVQVAPDDDSDAVELAGSTFDELVGVQVAPDDDSDAVPALAATLIWDDPGCPPPDLAPERRLWAIEE